MSTITVINPRNGAFSAPNGANSRSAAPIAPCPPMKSGGHGVGNGATAQPNGAPIDAAYIVARLEEIVARLEEAGSALLAMPSTGWSTQMRVTKIDVVREMLEGYGWDGARVRPAAPDARAITRMDEALGWIPLIPLDKYLLRRIVGARALVSPATDRHIYSWRRLGSLLGADHKAIQRWHAQGIGIILKAIK